MAEADTVPMGSSEAAPPPSAMSSLGIDDSKVSEITGKLADNQREKIAATDKVYGEIDSAQQRLLPRIEQLSKNAGVEAGNLKPWNADEEAAKRRTDPIDAFGSFGSVFGIIASAFTHAPMENALNASAAAMNAIKENDKTAYDRAEKAWMNNYKMAMDRHKIQHDAYQDAVSLLNVNMSAANTKLQVLASRFGDKQVLTLLEMGMSKEVQDVLASRQRMALELQQAMPKIQLENEKARDLVEDPRMKESVDSPNRTQAIREHQERWSPKTEEGRLRIEETSRHNKEMERIADIRLEDAATKEAARLAETERHRLAQEDIARRKNEISQKPESKFIEEYFKEHPDHNMTSPEFTDALKKFQTANKPPSATAGGNDKLTKDRQIAADVDKIVDKYKQENPDAPPEAVAKFRAEQFSRLGTQSAAPSGNKVDAMKSLYDRAGYMGDTIEKVEGLLAKHKALTGVGGTVTRPAEVVTNWFGSNETDRAQFKRYISELHEWGTRVLNESSGRPLSAEMSKLANILPGLSAGDTTANTVRAYRELKPLLGTIREQMKKRIEGTWTPEGAAKPTAKKPSWEDYPVVQ